MINSKAILFIDKKYYKNKQSVDIYHIENVLVINNKYCFHTFLIFTSPHSKYFTLISFTESLRSLFYKESVILERGKLIKSKVNAVLTLIHKYTLINIVGSLYHSNCISPEHIYE